MGKRTKKREQQLRDMKKRRAEKVRSNYVSIPEDASKGVPKVNYANMMEGIGRLDTSVFDSILNVLVFFEHNHFKQYSLEAIKDINAFCAVAQAACMCEALTPTREQAVALVQYAHIFHHLVAISGFETNDAALRCTLLTERNLPKILFLQNPRCTVQVDQKKFFDADPVLATMWFNTYLLGIATPTGTLQRNIYNHLQQMDERWTPYTHQVSGTYFTCTYHNTQAARRVKGIMNRAFKKAQTWEFNNRKNEGDKPHIAIVTCRWHRNHAVYKSAGPLVEQLLGNCKLTLIWTGDPKSMPPTAVTDYFDNVWHCWFDLRGEFHIPEGMKNNDFDMVYFPDIGMSNESIWLSNQRIAPIQAMGYGHPDTAGDDSEIDYFIGGDVEKDSTDQYAETMVLIPGLGQHPAWPTYERKNNYIDDDVVRMNCVWGPDKYNYTLLTVLAEINKTVEYIKKEKKLELPPHEIHLFASPGVNRYAALPSFIMEVKRLLPNAIIHSEQEYYDYMENAEMHDFSMNSFPFGCYNVLVESLYLGLPFVSLVGDRFYNRAGMWLNEQVGMSENNFAVPRDLINHAARLITEPDLLRAQREHLASVDLKERLFNENTYFKQAVDYILQNHPFTETKLIGEQQDD